MHSLQDVFLNGLMNGGKVILALPRHMMIQELRLEEDPTLTRLLMRSGGVSLILREILVNAVEMQLLELVL